MKENIRSRKGISMVEVVVALVVITIISLATLSVVFVSAKVEAKTIVSMEVRNSAENAVECFRFANGNKEIFIACLNETVADNGFRNSEEKPLVYMLDKGNYTITITLTEKIENDTETGDVISRVTEFYYIAEYKESGKIYDFTFQNGGEQE